MKVMARAATTFDVFNAVAEPKRRAILNVLAGGQLSVNTLVEKLDWTQPQVSKHLAVLKEVGLVNVKRDGRQQLYSVDATGLKPLFDWAKTFEVFWTDHLTAIKSAAEKKVRDREKGK